jgi:hypothetical protein
MCITPYLCSVYSYVTYSLLLAGLMNSSGGPRTAVAEELSEGDVSCCRRLLQEEHVTDACGIPQAITTIRVPIHLAVSGSLHVKFDRYYTAFLNQCAAAFRFQLRFYTELGNLRTRRDHPACENKVIR